MKLIQSETVCNGLNGFKRSFGYCQEMNTLNLTVFMFFVQYLLVIFPPQ